MHIQGYFRSWKPCRKIGPPWKKSKVLQERTDSLLASKYSLKDIQGNSEAILNLKKPDSPVCSDRFSRSYHGRYRDRQGVVCAWRSMLQVIAQRVLSFVSTQLPFRKNCLIGAFWVCPGRFTGAHHKGKIGKIELAESGTLFLDEIGELSLSAQAKLLRVLEEKRVERVGDVHPIDVDFRLVAATNKNLEHMVKEGKFRDDLFYRLGTMTLLSRRSKADRKISHCWSIIIWTAGRENRLKYPFGALNALMKYQWPGNIES